MIPDPGSVLRLPRTLWRRLRAWRRIRFTFGGVVFTVGTCAVGLAAVNAGNNLLYLLLGSMLGFIAVSGWFSERMMRDLRIERHVPHAVTVGQEAKISYLVRSRRKRIPTLALEIGEADLDERAFLARVPPGGRAEAHVFHRFDQRGVHPLREVTLSTSFPFGLFLKERDLELPGELVIWPRSDRRVRRPLTPGGARAGLETAPVGAPGARGEFKGLREYRAGDDPRDIHWKTSARLCDPVVREYEADASEELWICLDCSAPPGDAAEAAVEIAASLAAAATAEGRDFALALPDRTIQTGTGAGHLELALDALARVEFRVGANAPEPPVSRRRCVLVSVTGAERGAYGDVFLSGDSGIEP